MVLLVQNAVPENTCLRYSAVQYQISWEKCTALPYCLVFGVKENWREKVQTFSRISSLQISELAIFISEPFELFLHVPCPVRTLVIIIVIDALVTALFWTIPVRKDSTNLVGFPATRYAEGLVLVCRKSSHLERLK